MSSGFFQMGISKESAKWTAFTCFGTFKSTILSMGLKTPPNSFQLHMDKVLKDLTFKSVLCNMDNLFLCLIVLNNIYKTYMKSLVGLNPQA